MHTDEIIAILNNIIDFYRNDGHFIAENEAEKEIEALQYAIKAIELQPIYAEALAFAFDIASRDYRGC